MSLVDRLPNPLLERILDILLAQDPFAYVQCSRVCRVLLSVVQRSTISFSTVDRIPCLQPLLRDVVDASAPRQDTGEPLTKQPRVEKRTQLLIYRAGTHDSHELESFNKIYESLIVARGRHATVIRVFPAAEIYTSSAQVHASQHTRNTESGIPELTSTRYIDHTVFPTPADEATFTYFLKRRTVRIGHIILDHTYHFKQANCLDWAKWVWSVKRKPHTQRYRIGLRAKTREKQLYDWCSDGLTSRNELVTFKFWEVLGVSEDDAASIQEERLTVMLLGLDMPLKTLENVPLGLTKNLPLFERFANLRILKCSGDVDADTTTETTPMRQYLDSLNFKRPAVLPNIEELEMYTLDKQLTAPVLKKLKLTIDASTWNPDPSLLATPVFFPCLTHLDLTYHGDHTTMSKIITLFSTLWPQLLSFTFKVIGATDDPIADGVFRVLFEHTDFPELRVLTVDEHYPRQDWKALLRKQEYQETLFAPEIQSIVLRGRGPFDDYKDSTTDKGFFYYYCLCNYDSNCQSFENVHRIVTEHDGCEETLNLRVLNDLDPWTFPMHVKVYDPDYE